MTSWMEECSNLSKGRKKMLLKGRFIFGRIAGLGRSL